MESPTPHKSTIQLRIDWRWVSVALLGVIALMTFLWQPWGALSSGKEKQTITVRGEATLTQVPDSYVFTPYFSGADVATVTKTGNAAVDAIKKLGVKDSEIKSNVTSNNYGKPEPMPAEDSDAGSSSSGATTLIAPDRGYGQASYSLIVTVKTKELAQKVSDYLATSGATGQITPYAQLSKEATQELELKARAKASANARAKAEATAGELKAKVGKVTKVSDDGYYGIYPMARDLAVSSEDAKSPSSTPYINPGTNEVTYSLSVTFELK